MHGIPSGQVPALVALLTRTAAAITQQEGLASGQIQGVGQLLHTCLTAIRMELASAVALAGAVEKMLCQGLSAPLQALLLHLGVPAAGFAVPQAQEEPPQAGLGTGRAPAGTGSGQAGGLAPRRQQMLAVLLQLYAAALELHRQCAAMHPEVEPLPGQGEEAAGQQQSSCAGLGCYRRRSLPCGCFAESSVLPLGPQRLPILGEYSHTSKPAPMPSRCAQQQPPRCRPTGSGGFFAPLATHSVARMDTVSLLEVWRHTCALSAGSPHPAVVSHLRAVLARCGLDRVTVLHEQLLHLRFCCPVPLLKAPPGSSQKQRQQDAPAGASAPGLLEQLDIAGAGGDDDVTPAGTVSSVAAASQEEVAQELSALSDRLLDHLSPAWGLLDPAAAPVGSSAAAAAAEEQQESGSPVGALLQQATPDGVLADAVPLIVRSLPLLAQHACQSQLQQAFTAMMHIAGAAAGGGLPAGPQQGRLVLAVASTLQADTGLFEQSGSRHAFVTATLAQLQEVVSVTCSAAAAPAAGHSAAGQQQDDTAGRKLIWNSKAAKAAAGGPQGSTVCATAMLLLQQLTGEAASDTLVPQVGQLLEAAAAVLSTVGPALALTGTPIAGGSAALPIKLQSVAAACDRLRRALELAAGADPALDTGTATKLALAVLVCQAVLAAQSQAEPQFCGKQQFADSPPRVPQLAGALLAGQRLLLALLQRSREAAGALGTPAMLPKVLTWQHALCCWSEASSGGGCPLGALHADEQQQLCAGTVVEGPEAGGSTSTMPRLRGGQAGPGMGLAALQDSTCLVVQTLLCQALLLPGAAAQRQRAATVPGSAVMWMQLVAGQLQVCPGMVVAMPARGYVVVLYHSVAGCGKQHVPLWAAICTASAHAALQTCPRWVCWSAGRPQSGSSCRLLRTSRTFKAWGCAKWPLLQQPALPRQWQQQQLQRATAKCAILWQVRSAPSNNMLVLA